MESIKMITINLRDFYPFYTNDEFVEVTEEVAAEMLADKRYEKSHEQRMRRNKSFYSLDLNDGIEASAVVYYDDSPERIFALTERHCGLCKALNSLPETQGKRIEEHYILDISVKDIAEKDGVSQRNVRKSINRGLGSMKKYLINFSQQGTETALK